MKDSPLEIGSREILVCLAYVGMHDRDLSVFHPVPFCLWMRRRQTWYVDRHVLKASAPMSQAFVTPKDARLAKDLEKILSDAKQEVPAWLDEMARSSRFGSGGGGSSYGRGGGGRGGGGGWGNDRGGGWGGRAGGSDRGNDRGGGSWSNDNSGWDD